MRKPPWHTIPYGMESGGAGMAWTAAQAHRRVAGGLALFLAAHLAHHLAGAVLGPATHGALQGLARAVWRHPVVEPVLLGVIAAQVALGLVLVRRRRGRGVQARTGLVLAGFVPVHLGAILAARAAGQDTDLGFAAAGVQDWPWALFFVPYYGLAVWALLAHGAGGLARIWPRRAATIRAAGHVAGVVAALAILGLLAGITHPFAAPAFRLLPG